MRGGAGFYMHSIPLIRSSVTKFVFAEGTPPVTLRAPGTLGKLGSGSDRERWHVSAGGVVTLRIEPIFQLKP